MAVKFFLIFIFFSFNVLCQDTPSAVSTNQTVQEKEIEVAMGIDSIEKIDFDYNTKISIGNEQFLKLVLVPAKREIVFKGTKPGRTTVTLRDNLGDVRLRYVVVVTASGKSSIVSELRELIGDVEGIEIGIKGGQVYVGGELVVPDDIGRVYQVLNLYKDKGILDLIEGSPQTQRIVARRMNEELARNQLKDVTVRIVNKKYWLEGVVSNKEKKTVAFDIAKSLLPPRIKTKASGEGRFETPEEGSPIENFIAVNEKKEPVDIPKMVKVTAQFVELAKNYSKAFAFKWAPLMGEDASQISFGQREDGSVTAKSSGTLSATISNLFPKLNSAKVAGYARTIQSGMVIVRNNFQQGAKLSKQTTIPFALGSGDFTKATEAKFGLNLSVTAEILEQEKIQIGIDLSVSTTVGSSNPPVTTQNNVNTNLILKSKESAAIGGIVQNSSSTDYDNPTNDPAPLRSTGNTPASPLFRLFRSKDYKISKSQYVVFITPEIIESASAGTDEIQKKFRRRE